MEVSHRTALRARLICAPIFFAALALASTASEASESAAAKPRSRVVVAQDSAATDAFQARAESVTNLVHSAILSLTHKSDLASAWRSVVSTQDVVGLKVHSSPGANSGTRAAVVEGVLQGLLAAGVPAKQIVIWDRRLVDLRLAGYDDLARKYEVRLAASNAAGYDEKTFYENSVIGNLVAGDLEFDQKGLKTGKRSHVSKLLTHDITRIITITPLLNHNLAGVTGNLYSLAMGSIDNVLRFESDESRLVTAVPEVFALPALSEHVALSIVDALLCQYQGEQRSLLHYSTPLNQVWMSSDPVALDVMSIQELDRQRSIAKVQTQKSPMELYENAALLELGTSDTRQVRVELAPSKPGGN
jgi:hypothetical protein